MASAAFKYVPQAAMTFAFSLLSVYFSMFTTIKQQKNIRLLVYDWVGFGDGNLPCFAVLCVITWSGYLFALQRNRTQVNQCSYLS